MLNWAKVKMIPAVAVVAALTLVGTSLGSADMRPGPGGGDVPRVLSGTVTAVASGSFTLMTADGSSLTVATTASTRFIEAGLPMRPTGVAVGEHVVVFLAATLRGAPDPDDQATLTGDAADAPSTTSTTMPATPPMLTAAVVDIVLSVEVGVVTAVSGSTITLAGFMGSSRTVDVTASTRYFQRGVATLASSVKVGDLVFAFGMRSGTTFTATVVDIFNLPPAPTMTASPRPDPPRLAIDPARDGRRPGEAPVPGRTTTTPPTTAPRPARIAVPVRGTVVAVDGNAIIVDPPAMIRRLVVTAGTRFFVGSRSATLTAVRPGDRIAATGLNVNGTFFAIVVVVVAAAAPPAPAPAPPRPAFRAFPPLPSGDAGTVPVFRPFPTPTPAPAGGWPGDGGGATGGFGGFGGFGR